jgi:hypothetical protein
MTDQQTMERVNQEVHTANREKVYHQENTKKLHKAKDIYKESKGLDNISAHMKKQFDEIMLGGS